ncbi:2-phospho-L-lactate guanylyltransferase [Microbacterium sp. CJ88]|uniref:2-phospho-L-lactate guanylyltransferase n=1 Tax=Microbacterium sp. CJ88 TaxID=3445672 RepID=UPI003F655438
MTTAGWTVIVPVKPSAVGKSRLSLPGVDRAALARSIALDTIEAATRAEGVAEVIVVTGDEEVEAAASALPRARVVPERDARGLNGAIAAGAATAQGPRAALLGDLPALRSADLAAALSSAAGVDRGVVADAEGTGSTLVTVRSGTAWSSAFGDGSFARHVDLGFAPLDVSAVSTLRRDVDTADHLAAAGVLGLGPRTTALLGARGLRTS